jgi:hypothetical protein
MAELPLIDEHSIAVDRGPEAVWPALLDTVDGSTSSRLATPGARVLGCEDVRAGGPRPLTTGSTIVGFHVAEVSPGRELRLAGQHRFSSYGLVFRIQARDGGGTLVTAETRAVFPGVRGRIYRALVIGTRGHVLAVRRMLAAIERRAERQPVS